MSNILHQYYKGILQRLRVEVNLLNELIPHAQSKGFQNEESLINLLSRFIPEKYAIGSGMIIDSFGSVSKQIDIIIYNKNVYANLFSQTSTSLYPVETVIATIEVKTTLTNTDLKNSINNTESIRKLKHYKKNIVINQPTNELPMAVVSYPTRPPISLLFAYRVDSKNPKTWKKRFEKFEYDLIPEMSILLDIATVFRFKDIANYSKESFEALFYQKKLENSDEQIILGTKEKNKPVIMDKNIFYPSNFKHNGIFPILSKERAFLSFLISLNKLLDMYPKYTYFDPSKYLEKNYGDGQLI